MSGLATMRAMIELGLSDEQKLILLAAIEADAGPSRSTSAERQRRYRERKRGVTRDVTALHNGGDATVSPIEELHTPSGTDLPDEASASSPVRQPVSEARNFWNEVAAEVGWSQALELSPARTRLLGARLRQHGLDGWKAAIRRARASPYLGGADPPSWFTFPWLIKAENFLKTIEGNYDRNRSQNSRSGWQDAYAANAGPR